MDTAAVTEFIATAIEGGEPGGPQVIVDGEIQQVRDIHSFVAEIDGKVYTVAVTEKRMP